MPIVPKIYTKNLDVNLARRMDDTLTYFGFHALAAGGVSQETMDSLYFIRDAFRSYWQSIEAQWEGFEPEDFDATLADVEKACTMLGVLWGDLRW